MEKIRKQKRFHKKRRAKTKKKNVLRDPNLLNKRIFGIVYVTYAPADQDEQTNLDIFSLRFLYFQIRHTVIDLLAIRTNVN